MENNEKLKLLTMSRYTLKLAKIHCTVIFQKLYLSIRLVKQFHKRKTLWQRTCLSGFFNCLYFRSTCFCFWWSSNRSMFRKKHFLQVLLWSVLPLHWTIELRAKQQEWNQLLLKVCNTKIRKESCFCQIVLQEI